MPQQILDIEVTFPCGPTSLLRGPFLVHGSHARGTAFPSRPVARRTRRTMNSDNRPPGGILLAGAGWALVSCGSIVDFKLRGLELVFILLGLCLLLLLYD